ncbi:MAG: DUF4038 domain-containing protein [Verrucomicrobia bacterium]|nr:DUF4038 domain-containing protein [Verrucomicrobiota bacterium]
MHNSHSSLIPNQLVRSLSGLFLLTLFLAGGCATVPDRPEQLTLVPKWGRLELDFRSSTSYENPIQDTELRVVFTAPSGRSRLIYGFWDGDRTWKVRFAPNEVGKWHYSTSCFDTANEGLNNHSGTFLCTAASGKTVFERHGPIRVARDRRHFEHEDGTPFFWLADTAWNGPLMSTPADWNYYLNRRKLQRFTAVQWVTTQWRAAPEGDHLGELAFTGQDRIAVNPEFFQRLDEKLDAMNQADLLGVPVLLWAIGGGSIPQVNPGYALQEEQAVRLARYMVARWGSNAVAWFLAGDGDYRGVKAERWKRIGQAVFGDEPHAPVTMHPGGMQWIQGEFTDANWLDFLGYQSGHGDDARTLTWMNSGPPASGWNLDPIRPFINLEPPYENHVAYQSKTPISAHTVRRAVYWSLLNSPTAGVSYGGHGVWGWDDGTTPPTDHQNSGIPLPWKQALEMPGAAQMTHVSSFFKAIDFWRLRPAPEVLGAQPGKQDPKRHIAAARSKEGDLLVVYVPEDRELSIVSRSLPKNFSASWYNPRTGQPEQVSAVVNQRAIQFTTPSEGDWLLLVTSPR